MLQDAHGSLTGFDLHDLLDPVVLYTVRLFACVEYPNVFGEPQVERTWTPLRREQLLQRPLHGTSSTPYGSEDAAYVQDAAYNRMLPTRMLPTSCLSQSVRVCVQA